VDLDDWAGAVSRYAGRLHVRAGQEHAAVTNPREAQAETSGAFIRSQRELARLSLRPMAELTRLSFPMQADLIGGQGNEDPDGSRTTEHVAAFIHGDKRLTEAHKAAVLAVHDSMLRE
jgi:hypothetical protein